MLLECIILVFRITPNCDKCFVLSKYAHFHTYLFVCYMGQLL